MRALLAASRLLNGTFRETFRETEGTRRDLPAYSPRIYFAPPHRSRLVSSAVSSLKSESSLKT